MPAPPKPWEVSGGTDAGPSSATSTSTDTAPPVPERPSSLTSGAADPHSSALNSAYRSNVGGYGSGYGGYGGYGSSYTSPYSRMGAYGGMGYGGMGGYGMGYGGYGGMGYGGYGGMGYGGLGGYGGMGYGGYGGMGYGGMGQPGDLSLTQRMESGTQATFELISSIVSAFGGFAQMLESTFMATHSSFFAMVGVADQFAYLRNYLGQVLSIFALWRHAKNLLLRMSGRRPVGIDADEFRNFRKHGGGRTTASKPNKRPLFVFFLAVIGLPYLMGKLVKVITARQEAERARLAKEASESGMNLKQLMDAQGGAIDPSKLPFAVARWEYKATNPMELTLSPGDIVAVISKVNPDTKEEGMWWTGRKRDGSMGYFPSPYVEVVDMSSRPSASTQPKARAIEAPAKQATQHEATANKARTLATVASQVAEAPSGKTRRVIVSGIQPTGIPHIGNYLGALKSWVDLQNTAAPDDELFFFLADLHALTVPQDPSRLYQDRRNMMAALVATGIDPHRCTLFHQDEVPEHTQLMWFLSCITSFGRLERMTTWKSKLATVQDSDKVNEAQLQLGLFSYPVLQAADILIYHGTHVPVGEDQTQHLELTRDIAHQFNNAVKKRYFRQPEYMLTPTKRILSLRNPEQKMSKSAPDANSRILVTDSPEEIRAKVRRAVTDSERSITYEPERRPGMSNLVSILAAFGGGTLRDRLVSAQSDPDPARVAAVLQDVTGGSGARLKEVLTESIVEALRPFQTEYAKLVNEPAYLDEIAELGRTKASQRAAQTVREVRTLLGLQK
ncbi:tryptophan--tRNA ligase [Malassezia brasiliensis]|uniref:Tryptophan--tRNA ligase, mitochondrial n=1 Tax=Malassezia brasiliensis TaxID=1821822 RepID=A0AAF0DV19_9BASI|nr:tryptophan--tRNA ligase [Malassezia brasiliensis]